MHASLVSHRDHRGSRHENKCPARVFRKESGLTVTDFPRMGGTADDQRRNPEICFQVKLTVAIYCLTTPHQAGEISVRAALCPLLTNSKG